MTLFFGFFFFWGVGVLFLHLPKIDSLNELLFFIKGPTCLPTSGFLVVTPDFIITSG